MKSNNICKRLSQMKRNSIVDQTQAGLIFAITLFLLRKIISFLSAAAPTEISPIAGGTAPATSTM
jgi:hypothetical protein